MNASEQQDETRPGGKASKKPYTAPVFSEYGGLTGLTQGNLQLSSLISTTATITPLTVTLLDPG